MSRFMSVVWALQSVALLVLSVFLLVMPSAVPLLLDGFELRTQGDRDAYLSPLESGTGAPSVTPPPVADGPAEDALASEREASFLITSIRLLVPFILTLAIFTLQAFMREDERVRRRMSRVFAITGAAFIYLLLRSSHEGASEIQRALEDVTSGRHPPTSRLFLWRSVLLVSSALLVTFTACNLAYAVWPMSRAARRLSGTADTRPSQLWVLWLVQGLGFVTVALLMLKVKVVTFVLSDSWRPLDSGLLRFPRVADDVELLYPPLFLAMGLFSFQGMRASSEWNWRAFCRLFVILYGVWFLVFLFAWQTFFNAWLLLLLLPIVLMLLGNLRFARKSEVWFEEEVGEGPDGWILTDLVIGPLLLLKALISRRRPLFARGVAARGSLQVAPQDEKLRHPFFPPGEAFAASVRFSTEGADDAGLSARGVALHLSTPRLGSFDLLMSTGAYSCAENIFGFALAHLARRLGGSVERRLWARNPRMREGAIASLRRAPDSYALLHYYSQTVRFWVARNGTRYMVRYRLVPEHGAEGRARESGVLEARDGAPVVLDRQRFREERRSRDYLKRELKLRLEGGLRARMVLEAQFHKPEPGDNAHWFNPGVDWRADEHPWVRIGVLNLEDVLPDEQAELLHFNPANAPPSLGVPTSPDWFDYRSIADSEKRVHRRIQRTRQWMVEAFGLPALDSKPYEPQ